MLSEKNILSNKATSVANEEEEKNDIYKEMMEHLDNESDIVHRILKDYVKNQVKVKSVVSQIVIIVI